MLQSHKIEATHYTSFNPWTDVKTIMLSKKHMYTHCVYYFTYMKFKILHGTEVYSF